MINLVLFTCQDEGFFFWTFQQGGTEDNLKCSLANNQMTPPLLLLVCVMTTEEQP